MVTDTSLFLDFVSIPGRGKELGKRKIGKKEYSAGLKLVCLSTMVEVGGWGLKNYFGFILK